MNWRQAHVELRGSREVLHQLLGLVAYPRVWGAHHRNLFAVADETMGVARLTVRGVGTSVLHTEIDSPKMLRTVLWAPESLRWIATPASQWRIVRDATDYNPWNKSCAWYRMFVGMSHDTQLFCPDEHDRFLACLALHAPREVIFQQTDATPFVRDLVQRLKAAGTLIKIDADDLTFDEESMSDAVWRATTPDDRNEFQRRIPLRREMLGLVDEVLASTPEIQERASAVCARATLLPNRIPEFYQLFDDPGSAASRIIDSSRPDEFQVYYGGGGQWHRTYLQDVESQLLAFIQRFPNTRLVLGGGIRISAPTDRITFLESVLPEIYFHRLRRYDLVIAPLIDGPFSRAKSEIKVLEAAVQGVPFLASQMPNYKRFVAEAGLGDLTEPRDWESHLEQALLECKTRRRDAIEWARSNRSRYMA